MANGFFNLPAFNPGRGVDFEPVNNALTNYGNVRARNQQMEQQQAQNALMQNRWETENARAQQNHQNALSDRSWQVPLERQKAEAGLQLTQAQINKMNREPTGPEAPSNVREYQYFNSLPPDQQQQYLTMKRANQFLDLGDRHVQPNPMQPAGPPRAEIGKNLAEAERQKVVGRETGEGQSALPKAGRALQLYDIKTQSIDRAIDGAIGLAKNSVGTTGFVGAVSQYAPGTPAYNLARTIDTIKANAGFGELQQMRDNSPTGGALGQVAIQELAMLQATIASLEQSQTEEQLVSNLQYMKDTQAKFAAMRRQAYEEDVQRFGKTNVPNPSSVSPEQSPDSRATPRISGEADYNALPSGARYVDPNGVPRTKR